MTPQQFQELDELFQAARDLSPSDQAEFLDERCAGDAMLRNKLEQLLAQDRPYDNFLEGVIGRGASELAQSLDGEQLHPPRCIGSYQVVELLGTGGMGVVYLAQQERPQRKVAIKIIRPGLASMTALRRFENEVAALGRLQHPNIAQIFEAGMAEFGPDDRRPYFAMEFIKGRPLLQHAIATRLDVRQRAELLAVICDAVHYAHQQGIVHRDLKPGNILVDDSGQPKILDFGVACATDGDVQFTTLRTDVNQLMGTIAYMSPEQVGGVAGTIDRRADVYALGVLAYELLTGRLPIDVRGKPLPEAARIIQDEDPTPLSSRSRQLRGDLEIIVEKALEKHPARRYQTAVEMGDDLRRYLRNEPIIARRTSTWYQLRKFTRRNRALVGSVASIMVVLAAAGSASTWLWLETRAERDRTRRQRETAQWQAYVANIAAAEAAIRAFDVAEARRRLDAVPPSARAWEWQHLSHRLDRSERQLYGHRYTVKDVAYSPDGHLLASGSDDGTIRVWSLADDALLHELKGHTHWVHGIAFSPDGRTLASASEDGSVRLWDISRGENIAILSLNQPAYSLAWCNDGAWLACGCKDGVLSIWDALTGRQVNSIPCGADLLLEVVSNADGTRLAAAGQDGQVTIWDVATGRTVLQMSCGETYVYSVKFSSDGRRLAAGTYDGMIRVWDTESWGIVREWKAHAAAVRRVAFSPNGSNLFSASADKSIRVWDAASYQLQATLLGHTGEIAALAVAPDGLWLASGGNDRIVRLWPTNTDDVRILRQHTAWVYSLAFNSDGSQLASGGGWRPHHDGSVHIWEMATGRVLQSAAFAPDDIVWDLAWSADDQTVVIGQSGNPLRLWNPLTNAVTEITVPTDIHHVEHSCDGKAVLVGFWGNQTPPTLFDARTGTRVGELICDAAPASGMALAPTGLLVAAVLAGGDVGIWDVVSRRFVKRLSAPEPISGPIIIALSFDGSMLAAGYTSGKIVLWDVLSAELLAVLQGSNFGVVALAFSPDGARMASGGDEPSIRLWDLTRFQEAATLYGHTHNILCLAFSPDGRCLASASADRTVRLWETD
jgi:WD40 repeat protein/serine/threonine protein kinase